MNKRIVILLSTFTFLLSASIASAKTDVSVTNADITFSKTELVAGETVRVYARVSNAGDTDVSAYVQFLNNGTEMASAQPVSLKPDTYDDVFIDWKVAAGQNNIQANIIGATPKDATPTNDQTTVKKITVAAPTATQTETPAAAPTTGAAAQDLTPLPAPETPANWQEILTDFQESNPVKSGIASLDQTINDHVVKWYKLATGDKKGADQIKPSFAFDNWQAGIMGAISPYIKNTTYLYVGGGLLVLLILYFLFKKRKSRPEEYYD